MNVQTPASIETLSDLPGGSAVHFCGIGGSAMNGMAILLSREGFRITGTDPGIDGDTLGRLGAAGISVSREQDGGTIPKDAALMVATAAIPSGHPELVAAAALGVPVIKYAQMLGVLMRSFDGIAVSGTHGKTSTSAMTVAALQGAGQTPGYVIGGYVPQFGSGAQTGSAQIFVAEACEYDRSFLNLRPRLAIVTNVEADHLDIYDGLDAITEAFAAFVNNIPEGGGLLYCKDDAGTAVLAQGATVPAMSYGTGEGADYRARPLEGEGNGFEVWHGPEHLATVSLQVPGVHNVRNALAAFAAGHLLGADPAGLAEGLSSFGGVSRRFEFVGEAGGVTIVDDYAHHPTEIRALLQGAKERFPGRRIVAAFQPHQISRTKFFFDDFATSFGDADIVLLPDIYVARDKERPAEITSARLAQKMSDAGTTAHYTADFDTTTAKALELLQPGDVFLSVGAGNVFEVGRAVLKGFRQG